MPHCKTFCCCLGRGSSKKNHQKLALDLFGTTGGDTISLYHYITISLCHYNLSLLRSSHNLSLLTSRLPANVFLDVLPCVSYSSWSRISLIPEKNAVAASSALFRRVRAPDRKDCQLDLCVFRSAAEASRSESRADWPCSAVY